MKKSSGLVSGGLGFEEKSKTDKTVISALSEIGKDADELVIPCPNKLPEPDEPNKKAPVAVFDPAKAGRLAWEASEKELEHDSLGPAWGLQGAASAQTRKSYAPRYLRNAANVTIGEAPKFSVDMEEYGMALLRGMGFKPEKEVKPVELKKRVYTVAGIGSEKEFRLPGQPTSQATEAGLEEAEPPESALEPPLAEKE